MPITPYDSIFISLCVTLPSASCLSFHTSTYEGTHLSLAQTKQNKPAIFKNPWATIHSKLFRALIWGC